MPRNLRNFWVSAEVDGRKSPLAGGPVRKDGGMTINLYLKDAKLGVIRKALTISCTAYQGRPIQVTVDVGDDVDCEANVYKDDDGTPVHNVSCNQLRLTAPKVGGKDNA